MTAKKKATRGRPRNPDVDKQILETTRVLLAADGYTRTTLEAVAKAAGVTRPTIYLRWPSKEDLVISAIQDLQRPESLPMTGDTQEDLRTILRAVKKSFVDHGNADLMGPIRSERHHSPRLFEEFRTRLLMPRRNSIRAVLEQGIENGVLREDLHVDAAINVVIGSLYAKIMTGEVIDDEFADHVIDTIWTGMAVGS